MSFLGDLWDDVGGPIVGGLFGLAGGRESEQSRESADAANRAHSLEVNRENIAMQKEFAQHGIRWRVEDATAAGLHPLYALSGGGAAFSPNSAYVGSPGRSETGEALSNMGQDLSRSISAQETTEQRSVRMANLNAAAANVKKDEAMAAYYNALAAKESQGQAGSSAFPSDVVVNAYGAQSFPVTGAGRIEQHPLYADAVKLQPDEMASRSIGFPGETAGRSHPSMREFQFPGGFKMLLPATGGGGIPEDIDLAMLPLVMGANLNRFGWRFIGDFAEYMTGTGRFHSGGERQ